MEGRFPFITVIPTIIHTYWDCSLPTYLLPPPRRGLSFWGSPHLFMPLFFSSHACLPPTTHTHTFAAVRLFPHYHTTCLPPFPHTHTYLPDTCSIPGLNFTTTTVRAFLPPGACHHHVLFITHYCAHHFTTYKILLLLTFAPRRSLLKPFWLRITLYTRTTLCFYLRAMPRTTVLFTRT